MNKIHVVIPVYNVEKYLEQAVRSVLDQPYKGIDIVLVDDGSPDNSSAICDRLSLEHDRINVIHKENGGVSSARNAGIEFVINKFEDGYITFLDADDKWVGGVITDEIAESILDEWNDDIINFSNCRSNSQMPRFSHKIANKDNRVSPAFGEIWKAQETHLCAKLYSVCLLKKWGIRFIHKQQYGEDLMFIYQTVFLAKSIRYLQNCLHIYRGNPEGMMSRILKRDPIDHYTRIVDGWLKCDDFLNQYEEQTGRCATAGYNLGNVYLLDMVRYHYKKFGKRERLEDALKNHPYYEGLFKISINNASENQVRDRDLYIKHPVVFQLKYNVLGIIEKAMRVVKNSKLVASYWEKRKYPLDQLK